MSLKSIAKLYQDVKDTGSTDQIVLDYLYSVATIQDDRVQKRLLKELIREYVVYMKIPHPPFAKGGIFMFR